MNVKTATFIRDCDVLYLPLQLNSHLNMANKELNRLKVVLAEKKKTNKWLGEQLGKDKTTISKWCTNTCQPDLGSLMKIAKLLEVEVTDLLRQDNID